MTSPLKRPVKLALIQLATGISSLLLGEVCILADSTSNRKRQGRESNAGVREGSRSREERSKHRCPPGTFPLQIDPFEMPHN